MDKTFQQKSFTLVELLIIMSVVVVLISLLQPSLARISERGRQVVCANNLKQLNRAHELYSSDFNGEQVNPTHYLTADGLGGWPNVKNIPDRSLLILTGYLSKTPELFLCPSDSRERKDGPSKYIRSASFSYTRNGYIYKENTIKIFPSTVLLAEEDSLAPMNDATFYANQWDLLSTRHDGWGHISYLDGHLEQLDTINYNEQTATWRLDKYLWPKY